MGEQKYPRKLLKKKKTGRLVRSLPPFSPAAEEELHWEPLPWRTAVKGPAKWLPWREPPCTPFLRTQHHCRMAELQLPVARPSCSHSPGQPPPFEQRYKHHVPDLPHLSSTSEHWPSALAVSKLCHSSERCCLGLNCVPCPCPPPKKKTDMLKS